MKAIAVKPGQADSIHLADVPSPSVDDVPGGHSLYDQIGMQDTTTDDVYYERGINLLHGYLTERYSEDEAFVVPLPDSLREVGVLLEPLSVAEKGIDQAWEIQRRLRVWQPQRSAVLGSGTIGLLASLLTTPVARLERYDEMIDRLTSDADAIKVYVELSP